MGKILVSVEFIWNFPSVSILSMFFCALDIDYMSQLALFLVAYGKIDLTKVMDGVKAVTGKGEVSINLVS